MVFEQVLTIIFALAVGAAIVVYAARPRQRGASTSAGASVGSFAPARVMRAAPMPQVTAVETPAVETSSPEAHVTEVAPVVAAAGPIEIASVATPMANPSYAAPTAETVEPPAHDAAGTRKAQRKRSTTTKSRARSSSRTKKS